MAAARDVVVLVPGFLGFGRFGNFYYFADRVVAQLRGALEAQLNRPIPVIPCTSMPTNSLMDRQRWLLGALRSLTAIRGLEGVERFHLVGHSTGGVDAELLTRIKPLATESWNAEDRLLRSKIASIVTLASPHFGTCLANSGLAQFLKDPRKHAAALPAVAQATFDLARLLPREPNIAGGLTGAMASMPDAVKLFAQILQHRELINDLRPVRMEVLHDALPRELRVRTTCFVACAPPRTEGPPSDPFFVDLYNLTKGPSDRPAKQVQRAMERLNQAPDALYISSGQIPLPMFDPQINDGLVNATRQWADPENGEQLGGIVIGDHADILGHYDRKDPLADSRPLNAGLFHSGAAFGDNEFFRLYRLVAQAVARSIPRR